MLRETIKSLYSGYEPELEKFITDKEEKHLQKLALESYERLNDALGVSERRLLDEYVERLYDAEAKSAERAFVNGFCLGAKIAIEALFVGE